MLRIRYLTYVYPPPKKKKKDKKLKKTTNMIKKNKIKTRFSSLNKPAYLMHCVGRWLPRPWGREDTVCTCLFPPSKSTTIKAI